MAKTASFTAIADGSTTLDNGAGADKDKTFSFKAPGADSTERSILSFVVNPVPDGSDSDVKLEMSINGTVVSDVTFTSSQGRPWQEIVEVGVLKDGDNKLTAKVTDADKAGSMTIKDIVLLYKLA
jgi:hypothetical protein